MLRCHIRNRYFEYKPNRSPEDFIRNNELSKEEIEDKEWIRKTMIDLYETWYDENF